MRQDLKAKNRRVFAMSMGIVIAMCGLAASSVPLYNLFCRVTGYGGTTQQGDVSLLPTQISDREITIRFAGDTSGGLDWDFEPEIRDIRVKIGQPVLLNYTARNRTDQQTAGTALYNVTPNIAGQYFVKVECFCFTKQELGPHAEADLPVYFYIDPEILEDRNLSELPAITLTYTFMPANDGENG